MEKIEEVIKTSKKKLGEKIPCSIEILTPVHIGSGVKLANGIDFTATRDTVTIVPQAELMKYFESNPNEMQKFIDGNYKLDKITIGDLGKKYQIKGARVNEINEFERDGFGKPYIPGSSIKGAIRTALLKQLFISLPPERQNELLEDSENFKKGESWASEHILNEIFGKETNYNLMRTVQIYDAHFETDTDIERLHILSLKNESEYGWKRMGKDRNTGKPFPLQDDSKKSTALFVEVLPIGAIGYFSVSINSFLMNDPIAKSELNFKQNALEKITHFISTINTFSKEKLEKEKKFFEDLKNPTKLSSLINEIDKLIKSFSLLSKDEIILRISWGSGWKGMTGDLIDELKDNNNNKWLDIFRRKYNLGKKHFPIFPKTRRIVFDGNEPKYLLGWIKIKLNDKPSSKEPEEKRDEQQDPMELLKQKFKVIETKKK